MADRLTEKKEAAKKDEAYQPLWDTDQSIPEYMALLMGEQTQKNEDVELHEASDSEDSDGSNEPEDTSEDTPEDTHESRKDDEASTFGWNTSVCNRALFCRLFLSRSSASPTRNLSKCACWTARLNPPHPCRRAPPT